MADKSDISFSFDASSFKGAMNEMTSGMKTLTKNTTNMAAQMGKGMSSAMTAVAGKVVAIVAAVKGVLSAVKNYLPEVGSAFQIAGNIIMKNLFQPLRMQLLPLLNKFLDWVRNNRAVFVQFGGVLLNAFKAAVQILKTILKLLEPVLRPIKALIKSFLGDSVTSIADAINMILVKITAFVIFLGDLLGPLFEGIGKVIDSMLGNMQRWLKGFSEGFLKFFDKDSAFKGLERFSELLQTISGALKSAGPLYEALGKIVGTVFAGAVNILVDSLKVLADTLMLIFELIDPSKRGDALKKFGERLSEDVMGGGTAGMIDQIRAEQAAKRGGGFRKVNDAIITKRGEVIETSPDDNIIATKGMPGGGKSVAVTMTFGDFSFTVTEGNARAAGENFVGGLEARMRDLVLNRLATEAV